jgi:O-methyltransferase
MSRILYGLMQRCAKAFGYTLTKLQNGVRQDFDPAFAAIHAQTKHYTMTSPERMYALFEAVTYIEKAGIPGDIVECGVWRGGSMMLAAYTLKNLGCTHRTLWLYDTFQGMAKPEAIDQKSLPAVSPLKKWTKQERDGFVDWCYAPLDDVVKNLASTEYPPDKVKFVEGKVEDTLPTHLPAEIALLRLDTDFYSSTLHELTYLFPRLSEGGVLIIDDYGCWVGARKATDEYFARHGLAPLLHVIDTEGRMVVKHRMMGRI